MKFGLLVYFLMVLVGIFLGIVSFFNLELGLILFFVILALPFIFKTLKFPEFWLVVFSLSYFINAIFINLPFNFTIISLIIFVVSVLIRIYDRGFLDFYYVDFSLLVLVFWFILSWIFSFYLFDLTKLVGVCFLTILPYFLVRASYFNKKEVEGFLKYFIIGSVIISVVLLFNFNLSSYRLVVFDVNPIPIAIISGMSLIFSLYFIFNGNSKQKIINSFLICLFLIMIFLSGVRGVVISLLFGILLGYLFFYLIYGRKIKFNLRFFLILILGILLFFVLVLIFTNLSFERYTRPFYGRDVSFKLRQDYIFNSFNLIRENFFIGKGIEDAYPHNIFLEIFVESGILGLLIFICFLYLYFKKIIHNLINSKDLLLFFIFIGSCFLLIEAQFSLSLLGNKWLFILFSLGISLSSFLEELRTNK